MKPRTLLIGLTLAAIVFGVVRARSLRAALPVFDPTDEAIAAYAVYRVPAQDEILFGGAGPDDAQALWETSDIIVQASPTGRREAFESEALSEVEVTAVWKAGRGVTPGEKVFVYEPVFISPPAYRPPHVRSRGVNMLMQADRSYILCLRFYEKPEGYRYREAELRTYLLAFPACGIFPLRDPMSVFFLTPRDEPGPSYAEVRPYDCLAENEVEFQAFSALREDLFVRLGLR
ncbi:MAG: hypothetical protein LBF64_02300 [Oscillospiraceae bacterium]|nr:hypothetical protein [Oscillospiraceae bacterium]